MNLMKRFTYIFIFLLVSGTSFGQKAWDSTFRPKTYWDKVAGFKAEKSVRNEIIFLGNSITAHGDWKKLTGKENVSNRGISGDITFGVLERLDEVIARKPKKIFLLIGINDISRNIPDSLIIDNYMKIVGRVKSGSPRTRLYLQTILPVNNTFTKFKNHYNKDEHIEFVNENLRLIASQYRLELIDLHKHFLDSDGRLDKSLTHDGLHLTAAGYKLWMKILKKGRYLK